ncbi:hypothetical protein FE257_012882 [Aspergillus nanangensis]|uniref:Uncharacterized protein n=1 Tax=Aspergillus nanangensis TaxID=2582783 RepID=A0AAD4GQE8_ASPNN|nr:hypothetical protein FE257_012882 [Aspergillus nanangensis]
MASSFPYLLMVTAHKALSLYKITTEIRSSANPKSTRKAQLLASLKADSILAPMSLSLRVTAAEIISSIVYSFSHIGCGWSLGIQELHFNKDGEQVSSRLATTVDSQYGITSPRPFATSRGTFGLSLEAEYGGALDAPSILHQKPPTSVSYSHPYLLTSHADNTLTVYLVVSSTTSLYVKGGRRLWGHTSSVGTVQVSDRGKAISVSSHGDEIRIWELEALISTFGAPRVLKEESIQVSPEDQKSATNEGLGILSVVPRCEIRGSPSTATSIPQHIPDIRDCIGFDDERVLLLRESRLGTQSIELYDFT